METMTVQSDFFSPHLYHIYFKFFLPKISDVTAQLSCAMDFVEAATGWKHVIVRDVQSWFAHKTFCCQLIEIIITLHISQISQLSSSPSSGCTSSAALRAPWMSFFAHSLVSSSHTLTASWNVHVFQELQQNHPNPDLYVPTCPCPVAGNKAQEISALLRADWTTEIEL